MFLHLSSGVSNLVFLFNSWQLIFSLFFFLRFTSVFRLTITHYPFSFQQKYLLNTSLSLSLSLSLYFSLSLSLFLNLSLSLSHTHTRWCIDTNGHKRRKMCIHGHELKKDMNSKRKKDFVFHFCFTSFFFVFFCKSLLWIFHFLFYLFYNSF